MEDVTMDDAVAAQAEARRAAKAPRRPSADRHNMQAVYDAKPLAYKAAKRAFDVVLGKAGAH